VNIPDHLTRLSTLGARWVLWLLILLSVVALAIVIERAVLLWSSRDDVLRLRAELRRNLGLGDIEAARLCLEKSPSYEARVAGAVLQSGNAQSGEERLLGETEVVRQVMERRLPFLGTLGNNAPFVGLLGTVIGIVRSFRELSASGGQVSESLMVEVGEALVATAIGLVVALPAIAFFNLFQRAVRERLGRAEVLGREVLA